VSIPKVLADTNVCYPLSSLDLILRCDEASLLTVLWTEDLLAELSRKWVEKNVRSEAACERICQQIRDTFVGQDIPRTEYEPLIASMPGKDPDDHVHAAAAVARSPVTILTHNVRDFPAAPLAQRGVTVISPDTFFVTLADTTAASLVDVIVGMAASRRNPPMTAIDVLDALGRAGLPRFATRMRFEFSAD
jgi:PIN domain